MKIEMEKLKYPIGRFQRPETYSKESVDNWIASIETFPQSLHYLSATLTIAELNYHYRPDGWMIKQVVHHCADSHMNSLIRFKLALTEDNPSIRPYLEDRWALLPDSLDDDIRNTLQLISALHRKLVQVLRHMTPDQMMRTFVHPASGDESKLYQVIALYAWHSNHHLAHVQQALKFKGQFAE